MMEPDQPANKFSIDPERDMEMIADMPEMPPAAPISVTELTARIKQMLEQGFAGVEVRGEVSRLTRPASGHLYFTIKDAHASISAVVWRSAALRLKKLPEEGGEFIFCGHLSVYEPRGSYQLVVSRIEAAGAGRLAAEFERRKKDFSARGWFDAAGKKAVPALPEHIGIVTSPTAAALEDVKKALASRPAWIQLTLSPCLVQGERAASAIAAAINRISIMESPPDIILLVRGGGSIEDLWCYNDEAVVKAVVDCPIPLISGIGHEIDVSLADFAADKRASTPSNAAELCCPTKDELRQRLPRIATLAQLLRRRLMQAGMKHDALINRLVHIRQRRMDALYHNCEHRRMQLKHLLSVRLQLFRSSLRQLEKRLNSLEPGRRLRRQRQLATEFSARLTSLYARRIQRSRQDHAVVVGKLNALNPMQVLERGYSLSYASDGQLLTSVSTLHIGDAMQVHFHDGAASTRIESIDRKIS